MIRGLDTARFQQVLVTDLHGTVVRARQLHSSETHLDLSTLPAGLYLITLHGKWGSERMPVIKVR